MVTTAFKNSSTWNPENFNVNDFSSKFSSGYGALPRDVNSFINESTEICQLIAISTYLVNNEPVFQEEDDQVYQEETEIGLTYLAFAY